MLTGEGVQSFGLPQTHLFLIPPGRGMSLCVPEPMNLALSSSENKDALCFTDSTELPLRSPLLIYPIMEMKL